MSYLLSCSPFNILPCLPSTRLPSHLPATSLPYLYFFMPAFQHLPTPAFPASFMLKHSSWCLKYFTDTHLKDELSEGLGHRGQHILHHEASRTSYPVNYVASRTTVLIEFEASRIIYLTLLGIEDDISYTLQGHVGQSRGKQVNYIIIY